MRGKVIFHELFPTTNFGNIRVGLELEFNDGQDYNQVYEEAKAWVQSKAPTYLPETHLSIAGNQTIPIVEIKPEEKNQDYSLFDKIQASENITELKSWQILIHVEKNEVVKRNLLLCYDQRLSFLQNQTT